MRNYSDIVKRYFQGTYSRSDYRTMHNAFHGKEELPEIRTAMENHWLNFETGSAASPETDQLLDKIQHQIRLDENNRRRNLKIWTMLQRIAATLFVPLLLAFLAYIYLGREHVLPGQTAYAEIQCPLGVRTRFELPDGTTGFLNSGSTLKYPVQFTGNRRVKLSGEAYFEVSHDANSPFHVKTRNLDIKVIGTVFNVIAYDDEKNEEVILQEGKVDVSTIRGKNLSELAPDQRLVFNSDDHKFLTEKVTASQYVSWKDGKLVFRNEQMNEVAARLSRWYNVEVEVADKQLENYTYHATFIDEPLDEVLKLLALTTPISYVDLKRETSKDGVYGKRKVILKINPERLKEFK